jgi:hypothetical protein
VCLCGIFCAGWWVVEGVAEWGLVGVEPAGWGEVGVAVDNGDDPFLGVDDAVMRIAD